MLIEFSEQLRESIDSERDSGKPVKSKFIEMHTETNKYEIVDLSRKIHLHAAVWDVANCILLCKRTSARCN